MAIPGSSSSGQGKGTTPQWPASSSSEPIAVVAPQGPVEPAEPAEPEQQRRLRLLVAYLGAPYHGFALQAGTFTVASALGSALERVLRHPVELTCAGRTDAGVHAWGQVVTLDARSGADLARLQRSVNKMLAPTITVREATWAPAGFDARRSALSRVYRYNLLCSEWPDPLTAATTWHVGRCLDLRAMETATDVLLGEHDFTSFCHAVRGNPAPLVRRVVRAQWSDLGDLRLCLEIEAVSFCHQMVRSIVGLVVDVGTGRRKAGELMSVFAARSRSAAGQIAPPHGLCLWEVKYPHEALDQG